MVRSRNSNTNYNGTRGMSSVLQKPDTLAVAILQLMNGIRHGLVVKKTYMKEELDLKLTRIQ